MNKFKFLYLGIIFSAVVIVAASCSSRQAEPTATLSTVLTAKSKAAATPRIVSPTVNPSAFPPTSFPEPQPTLDFAKTQNASDFITNTAIAKTLQATVTPESPQRFISPDGKYRAEVIIYGCTNIPMPMNMEGTYSYEILKITNLSDQKEQEVENQLIYCQGLGAYGLGGLFWSTNSRYFYYTTAREGVPDGSGGFAWMRPASRFDVSTGEKLSLGGLEFSPDRSKVAAADGIDLVVWDLQGKEIARFPGKDFITDQSINAWLSYFTWSPDGKSLAYIIRISSNMTSDVLLAKLDQKQSTLLLPSSTLEFGEVHWKDQNHLSLVSWQDPSALWEYDLTDKSLIPPPENTASPTTEKPSPLPTLTTTPAAALITPIATGHSVGTYSISPDSRWLPTVDFDQETLHFFDLSASTSCDFPSPIGYPDPDRFLAWLPEGRVVVQAVGQALAGKPYTDFAPATPQEKLALDHQDPSFSPDARYQAVEKFNPNTQGPNQTTTIVEVATDTTVAEATYDRAGQGGGTMTGYWIDSSHFLIGETMDQGPLLLAPGRSVVKIATEIFGLPIKPGSGQFDLWDARSDDYEQSAGPFHLMLSPGFGSSGQGAAYPLQIYHSETGKVETLPYLASEGAFSRYGHRLLVTTATPQGEKNLYRPIDSPESTFQLFDGKIISLTWSPDGSRYYDQGSQDQTIAVYSFPGNRLLGRWQAPDYELWPSWSLDGKYLVIWSRKLLDYSQEAIFVIRQ